MQDTLFLNHHAQLKKWFKKKDWWEDLVKLKKTSVKTFLSDNAQF